MNRMQSGGGMPSMDELMQDPTLRNMCAIFNVIEYMIELTISKMFSVQTNLEDRALVTQGVNMFLQFIISTVLDSVVDTVFDCDTLSHKNFTLAQIKYG
jgi:hypothetical protein